MSEVQVLFAFAYYSRTIRIAFIIYCINYIIYFLCTYIHCIYHCIYIYISSRLISCYVVVWCGQAEAVAALRLSKLTSLESENLRSENKLLKSEIKSLEECLVHSGRIFDIMKQETLELKAKFGIARRSKILFEAPKSLSEEDLIANSQYVPLAALLPCLLLCLLIYMI